MTIRLLSIPELRSIRSVLVLVLVAAAAGLCIFAPSAAHAAPSPVPPNPRQEFAVYLPAAFSGYVRYAVDVSNRQAVRDFFYAFYVASEVPPIDWTGDHASCSAGDTNAGYRLRVQERVNFYRAMAGVPAEVVFVEEYNRKAQAAALLMSENDDLSHNPPDTWTCYSQEAYDGASSSNIGLGLNGPDGIHWFMHDPGANNYGVGHRRWILLPWTRWMGTGNVPHAAGRPVATALYVVDTEHRFGPRPDVRDYFIAWPPPGYTPYQVVFPRWSFSYPNADFASAVVTVLKDGVPFPVTLEALYKGAGDPTIVWRPSGMDDYAEWEAPQQDTTYTVAVSNFLVDGQLQTVTHSVIVFDPEQ